MSEFIRYVSPVDGSVYLECPVTGDAGMHGAVP